MQDLDLGSSMKVVTFPRVTKVMNDPRHVAGCLGFTISTPQWGSGAKP